MPQTNDSIDPVPARSLSSASTQLKSADAYPADLPFEGIAPAVVHFYFSADVPADAPITSSAGLLAKASMPTSILQSVALALLLPLAAFLVGCQSAHVPHSTVSKFPGSEPEAQLDFWHELATRPLTSNDDAFHALLLYTDGKDDAGNYDQRVAMLKSRSLLPASFNESADLAVQRGDLAVPIVKILKLKGGWAMYAFGPTPRYALRELVYADIYPPSSPQQTFSGSEFVGVIGKLEDTQRTAVLPAPVSTQQ